MPSSPGSCNTSSPAPTDDISEQDNVELESSNNEQTGESPDQSESESNFTDCTSTPKNTTTKFSRMSDPSIETLSPAYSINASLSKITVNNKLTDSNYISWAVSIQRALRSVGLQNYIKNESLMSQTKNFNIHCDCITNWVLNSMDSINAN